MPATRFKPGDISWPLSPEQIEGLNEMLRELYEDVLVAGPSSTSILAANAGGTGIGSYVIGDILYADTTSSLAKLAIGSATRVLKSDGTLPTWDFVALSETTGNLGATRGGTDQTAVAIGDLLYGSALNTWSRLAISATAGRYLRSGGSGSTPSWSLITLGNVATTGTIAVASATSVVAFDSLTPVAVGQALMSAGAATVPAYSADPRLSGSVGLKITANGQEGFIKHQTELTIIAAAATTDTTIQFPANSLALGATFRVTVVIPTAATFDAGDATTPTLFVTGISTAANTTAKNPPSAYTRYTAATSVRITPNATPADNSGRVRVTIYYVEFVAPTS